MRNAKYVLLALLALTLVIAGCEREITGDVELADQSASNCFECHSDSDWDINHAQDQFANTRHATGETVERNRLYNSRYAGCERCHTHEGFVANVNGESADGEWFSNFNCFTCHQPHTNGNLELRVQNAVALQDGSTYDRGNSNTCASCHQSRRNASEYVEEPTELSSHFGPHHSNQSDMFVGTNGFEYPGYSYTTSWHGQNISSGCVRCHMGETSVWGEVGGHTFAVDAGEGEDEVQNIGICQGCHEAFEDFNPDFPANSDYDGDGTAEGVQVEVEDLTDSLQTLLIAAGLLEEDAEDPGAYHPTEDLVVGRDSAGAVFNWAFVHDDQSHGIHNTNYAIGLLMSSINYMNTGDPNGATVAVRPETKPAH